MLNMSKTRTTEIEIIIDYLFIHQNNALVDESLWRFIQDKFSTHVQSRHAGVDDVDVDEVFPCHPVHQFAEQGDIRFDDPNCINF